MSAPSKVRFTAAPPSPDRKGAAATADTQAPAPAQAQASGRALRPVVVPQEDDVDIILYAHPSMAEMAKSVAMLCSETVDKKFLQEGGKAKTVAYRDTIRWGRFADGFPDLFISNVEELVGRDVCFLASFHDAAQIFEQLAVLYSLPRYLCRSLTVVLPYFPCATMERVDHEGQVATAMTMATLLSTIPLSRRGPAHIVIYDIHTLQNRFYFTHNVIPRLESGIPLLLQRLKRLPVSTQATLAIAFPDEGAYKRFRKYFEHYDTIVCHKVRDGASRKIVVKEGDVAGKTVVIVDDLVQTGGTLLSAVALLRTMGASSVSCYVTHPVFPDKESWKRFQGGEVDHFWYCDTCPQTSERLRGQKPFELLSIAMSIADDLLNFDVRKTSRSVSCHDLGATSISL